MGSFIMLPWRTPVDAALLKFNNQWRTLRTAAQNNINTLRHITRIQIAMRFRFRLRLLILGHMRPEQYEIENTNKIWAGEKLCTTWILIRLISPNSSSHTLPTHGVNVKTCDITTNWRLDVTVVLIALGFSIFKRRNQDWSTTEFKNALNRV